MSGVWHVAHESAVCHSSGKLRVLHVINFILVTDMIYGSLCAFRRAGTSALRRIHFSHCLEAERNTFVFIAQRSIDCWQQLKPIAGHVDLFTGVGSGLSRSRTHKRCMLPAHTPKSMPNATAAATTTT